jgi:adenylyltransferase/sulfurtransferase
MRVGQINSVIRAEAFTEHLGPESIDRLLGGVSLVIDGTDNLDTRYLVNDWCVKHRVPWIYQGAVDTAGQVMAIDPRSTDSPCLRCYFPDPAPPGTLPTCDVAGVLGPLITLTASVAVADALAILTEAPPLAPPGPVLISMWPPTMDRMRVPRDPDCPCCGRGEYPFLDAEGIAAESLCGRNAVQVLPRDRSRHVDLARVAADWDKLGDVTANAYLVRLVPRVGEANVPTEITLYRDGRAVVMGTAEEHVARGWYDRYVGG